MRELFLQLCFKETKTIVVSSERQEWINLFSHRFFGMLACGFVPRRLRWSEIDVPIATTTNQSIILRIIIIIVGSNDVWSIDWIIQLYGREWFRLRLLFQQIWCSNWEWLLMESILHPLEKGSAIDVAGQLHHDVYRTKWSINSYSIGDHNIMVTVWHKRRCTPFLIDSFMVCFIVDDERLLVL